MSVRANLAAETMGLAAEADCQGSSAGRLNAGDSSVSAKASSGEFVSFRDRWQAQVDSMHPANRRGEDLPTGLSSPEGAEQIDAAADMARCADFEARFLQTAAEPTTPADMIQAGKSSVGELRVRRRELAPDSSDVSNKVKRDRMAGDDPSQFALIAIAAAALFQPSPDVTNEREQDLGGSTASIPLNAEAISRVGFPAHSPIDEPEQPVSYGRSDVGGSLQIAIAQQDGPVVEPLEDSEFSAGRKSSPDLLTAGNASSRRFGFHEPALDRDSSVDRCAEIVGEVSLRGERGLAAAELRPVPGSKVSAQIAGDSEMRNDNPAAAFPVAVSPDATRNAEPSTKSQVQPSLAAVAGELSKAESSKSSRLSTSRVTLSTSRTQKSAANSSDAIVPNAAVPNATVPNATVPNAANVQLNSETLSGRAAPPKVGVSIPGDARLQETFYALDSGMRHGAGEPVLSRSGRVQAEAGFEDPALGWVGVRAESSRGVVHATVLSPSPDAAQSLSGHMAGLHTYLADNRTPVETLTLASFGNGEHSSGQQREDQGAEQHSGRNNSDTVSNSDSITRVFAENSSRNVLVGNEGFVRVDADLSFGGRHISVVV